MSHPVSVGQQRFVIFKFVKKRPVHFAALVALGAAGAFLRLYFYFINRSLWLDEALLANFIVNRSFIGWFAPLSEQVVPIFFALLEKLAITIFGRSDWGLRLVPLLTGLAAIPILAWVAKKYSGTWAVYSSLLLLILSPRLIYYSSEVKQYSSDVLFALLLLLAAAYCLEERAKPLPFVLLGLMGLLTGWLSHPGVFVFAGVWGSLGLAFALRKDKRRLIMMLMMGGGWAASLILVYFVALKDVTTAQSLTTYWTNSFAPLPPWSHLGWYYRALKGMLLDPAGLSGSVVLVGLLAVGVISMAFRHWLKMLILVSPFLITLAASALQKYPFNGRLLLFLVPLLFLLLAEAVQRVYSLLAKLNRPAAGLVALALLGGLAFNPFVSVVQNLQTPPMGEDIKPVLAYIHDHAQPDDLIYVYYGSGAAFNFYAPDYGFTLDHFVIGVSSRSAPEKYLEDVAKLRGNPRVWFLFSHVCDWCQASEEVFILKYLDGIGKQLSAIHGGTASGYLYELAKP